MISAARDARAAAWWNLALRRFDNADTADDIHVSWYYLLRWAELEQDGEQASQ